jgi:hypothetical protein
MRETQQHGPFEEEMVGWNFLDLQCRPALHVWSNLVWS